MLKRLTLKKNGRWISSFYLPIFSNEFTTKSITTYNNVSYLFSNVDCCKCTQIIFETSINHLKFTCEKCMRGSRESHCREYFSLQTIVCHINEIKQVWKRFGRENKSPRTSSSLVNRELKSSRTKVGKQYLPLTTLKNVELCLSSFF